MYKSSELQYNSLKYGSNDKIEQALLELEKIAESQLRQQAALGAPVMAAQTGSGKNTVILTDTLPNLAAGSLTNNPELDTQIANQKQQQENNQNTINHVLEMTKNINPNDLNQGYTQEQVNKLKESILKYAPEDMKPQLAQLGISPTDIKTPVNSNQLPGVAPENKSNTNVALQNSNAGQNVNSNDANFGKVESIKVFIFELTFE